MKSQAIQLTDNAAVRRVLGDRAEDAGSFLASLAAGSILGVTVLAAMKVIALTIGFFG